MSGPPRPGTDLTPAELAALEAWAAEGSIPAAARSLGRSPYTIAEQLRNARSRLGARTNADAAEIAQDRRGAG